jgi:hypothetical protein
VGLRVINFHVEQYVSVFFFLLNYFGWLDAFICVFASDVLVHGRLHAGLLVIFFFIQFLLFDDAKGLKLDEDTSAEFFLL